MSVYIAGTICAYISSGTICAYTSQGNICAYITPGTICAYISPDNTFPYIFLGTICAYYCQTIYLHIYFWALYVRIYRPPARHALILFVPITESLGEVLCSAQVQIGRIEA